MNEIDRMPSRLSYMLGMLGIVVVGAYLIQLAVQEYLAPWVFVSGLIAILGWLFYQLTPRTWKRLSLTALVVMIVFGGVAAVPSNGLMIVLPIVGVMIATTGLRFPQWFGFILALVAGGFIALGALTVTVTPAGLLAMEAGVAVAVLAGISRRQFRASEAQSRELFERTAAAQEEHARAAALAAQQSVARDIHDVLAHSLGGLVIQLDAVEALLEAGDTDAAAVRVRDSRSLAANGLSEARRAVDALRDPGAAVDVAGEADAEPEFADAVTALIDAHRALGGTVDFTEMGAPRPLRSEQAVAVRRALQEALSNVRKHAPGAAVSVHLDWSADAVRLAVENPLVAVPAVPAASATRPPSIVPGAVDSGTALAATGGGHGLVGMRERFAALSGGGSVTARPEDGRFVVRAEVRLT